VKLQPFRQSADHNLIKTINRNLVLTHLRNSPGISRAELAKLTGLTRGTVSTIIQDLLDAGLVVEKGTSQGAVGRPSTQLMLDTDRHALIGATLETDHLSVVVTTLGADILFAHDETFRNQGNPEAVLDQLGQVLASILHSTTRHVLGIGVGVAGIVDAREGVLVRADHYGWHQVPIRQPLAERLGTQVEVERSSHAALLGEQYFGAARDASHVLYVDVEARGIGGSYSAQDELIAGWRHFGCEFGHMTIEPAGPLCVCGNHGCWEMLASEKAALRFAQEGGLNVADLTFPQLVALAYQGNSMAQAALHRMGTYLGIGLANLMNIYDPQLVIVGGRVTSAGELVWGPMRRTLAERALAEIHQDVRIVPATLGERSTTVGSACLVFRSLLTSPSTFQAVAGTGRSSR